jgi:polysaccharide export outer membrane protein
MKFAILAACLVSNVLYAADLQSQKADGPAAGFNLQATPCVPVDSSTYVIGAEDVLSVIVFEDHAFDMAQEQVRPDGRIGIPLAGDVTASGKTPEQVETEIANLLASKYMKIMPHVNVIIRQVNSKYFYINGEVNRPARYPLTVATHVMEALVNAGGFKDFAKQSSIPILRDGKVIEKFNFKEALEGKHPERNILLQPGDIIVVK